MNRSKNRAALETILQAMRKQNPNSHGMKHLRRAAYLHTIVAAMLNERVACLPETERVCS